MGEIDKGMGLGRGHSQGKWFYLREKVILVKTLSLSKDYFFVCLGGGHGTWTLLKMGWELGIGSWKSGHAKKKGGLEEHGRGWGLWGGGRGWWTNRVWLTRVGLRNKEVHILGWVIEVDDLDW
jgi:hypothetical protein